MVSANAEPLVLAAYYWSPYLTLAVLCGEHVIETACHRVSTRARLSNAPTRHISALVNDYAPVRIVVPPVLALDEAARRTGIPTVMLSIGAAKAQLTGNRMASHRELYRFLLARFPVLDRLVRTLPSGEVMSSEPWNVAQLLPIALALAVLPTLTEAASPHRSPTPKHPTTSFYP